MATYIFNGECPSGIKQAFIDAYKPVNDKLKLVVETTSSYKKSGIYSAQRDDTSKPIVIDWGDGTVEQVTGDISQKEHEYASVGTFNVTIQNIKSYSASSGGSGSAYSDNSYTLTEVIKTPDSLTTLPRYAFCYCGSLKRVIIGSGILYINYWAFGRMNSEIDYFSIDKTINEVQNMNPNDWFYPFSSSYTQTIHCSDGSFTITASCILKGTDILLADGTTKKIENLTYDDVLKVWDFDEGQLGQAKVCWLTRPSLKSDHYYQLTFDNGTVLKTTGINSNHRIFSVDQSRFTNVADAKVGDKVFSIDGTLTITDVKYVEEECEYYNVMTSGKINCFANGILTSDRYGNIYPIVDMKYVKDGRMIRPYSEYEAVGIDRYWYDNLRLGENTETVEKSKEYVWKCLGQMLPLPDNNQN